jgi:hypothetical protein
MDANMQHPWAFCSCVTKDATVIVAWCPMIICNKVHNLQAIISSDTN